MIGQEIIQEIDNTLDQLIRNAEMMSGADLEALSEIEVDAFQKTQESLLHHLLYMDQCLASKQWAKGIDIRSATHKIHTKRIQFEQMKSQYSKRLEAKKIHKPVFNKRRKKRFFERWVN